MPNHRPKLRILRAAVACASLAAAGCTAGQQASAPGSPSGSGIRGGAWALEPESLVGRDGRQLESRLGRPDYRREEGRAMVWQYRLDGCVVDFVLYGDGSGFDVAAWRGRSRVSGGDYNHRACARELARRGGRR